MANRWWWMAGCAAAVVATGLAGSRSVDAQGSGLRFRKHVISFGLATGSVVAADFNRDGKLDVAAAANEEVAWFDRGERPSFWKKNVIQKQTTETGSVWSAWLVAHDLDGDGDLDLLSHTLANGNLAWYECPADPTQPWKWRLIDNLPGVHFEALEDLNRDGRPELVANHEGAIVWYSIPRNPQNALAANYRGEAGGRTVWERKQIVRSGATGQTHYLSFVDLDKDGDRDIVTGAAEGGYLAWWERPADATLIWTKHLIRDEMPGATHCIPVDVNQDSQWDLIYSRGHGKGIGWLVGPRWQEERVIDDGWLEGPHTIEIADLDKDGDYDIISAGRTNGRTAWFEADSKGKFVRREMDPAQSGNDIRSVDVDGDGDLDLIQAGESSKNVIWWENLRL